MIGSLDWFFKLVRLGIGKDCAIRMGDYVPIDWESIEALASQQGLSAIVVDGIDCLPDTMRPPKQILLQWIGEVMQGYEYRYMLYKKTIGELAGFYKENGFRMMVLKGYACSINWPKPEHRPCGDIDIWQFGCQKEADRIVKKEKGIKIDTSHHHHTVFYWRDFVIENHYDFINIHAHKYSGEIEKQLKLLSEDDKLFTEIDGVKVFLPSPNLHALFLIVHNASHFALSGLTVRQILDWAFFVEKNTKEIDWNWLSVLIEKYNLTDFINCINAICVEELGFESKMFPAVQFSPVLKERVLDDIMKAKYIAAEPKHLIPRFFYKMRRWADNAWKRELCYKETRYASLFTILWTHTLKPSSF